MPRTPNPASRFAGGSRGSGTAGGKEKIPAALGKTVDPKERSLERRDLPNGFVDSRGLLMGFRIHGADNDSRVFRTRAVESDELPPVQCEDCSSVLHREVQNLLIGDGLIRLSGLLSR